ncbi:MAG: dienelactone hydrolase family protein [Paracoccaceae bacterium]
MTTQKITAPDGHKFSLYCAMPEVAPRGAIIVLQEIFGVNSHIRSVCDRLAQLGYVAAAPALFDRIERDYDTGYSPEEIQAGLAIMKAFDMRAAEADLRATIDVLMAHGPVSIMGFCLGGSLAYRMATIDDRVASAACYYGGLIEGFADQAPLCPVVLHYGAQDKSISAQNVATVRAKQPDLPIYVYPAGHGFNCDSRGAFDPSAAAIAWARSLRMIDQTSIRPAG